MSPQEIFDFIDEEIEGSIKKMIVGTKDTFERYKAEIGFGRHLKDRIKSKLQKEAKNAVAKR
jgi:hypothetical protein